MLVATAALAGASARAQSDQDKEDKGKKELAVKSPWGSFDAQVAADAKGLGLPVYPGAELLKDKDDQALHAELKIEGKPGIKFIVGKFQTRDSRDKVLAFYQKELGKKVTKFTAKDDGGNAVFEIKHKLDQRYVSLKSGEGTTRIDMVRIEGIESDDADVK
ncbi:MAG TPA: hypothetical protein VKU44_09905 [Terriglobia bacterium]|nr:hypothetical protein [Terriglobia bacterium]